MQKYSTNSREKMSGSPSISHSLSRKIRQKHVWKPSIRSTSSFVQEISVQMSVLNSCFRRHFMIQKNSNSGLWLVSRSTENSLSTSQNTRLHLRMRILSNSSSVKISCQDSSTSSPSVMDVLDTISMISITSRIVESAQSVSSSTTRSRSVSLVWRRSPRIV